MKVTFVVTTHHANYKLAEACLIHLVQVTKRFPMDAQILLYLNEPTKTTKKLVGRFSGVDTEVVERQVGGLTYTWNAGIEKGMAFGSDVFVLLNDDTRVNASLVDLILAASNGEDLAICGPATSPEGAPFNPESWVYTRSYRLGPSLDLHRMKQWHGLNGFCLAFHRKLLEANCLDGHVWFDQEIPFGGNETEFGKRWFLQGGSCAIVYSCFVEHQKRASWRKLTSKTNKVEIRPPHAPVTLETRHPSDTSLIVVSFSKVENYKGVPDASPSDSVSYVLLVAGLTKDVVLPPAYKGWILIGQRNRHWNSRLRLKHLLDMWPRLRCDRLVVTEQPNRLADAPQAFVASALPLDSPAIAALQIHASSPTLAGFHTEKCVINEFMMERFPVPDGPKTSMAYHFYPLVLRYGDDAHDYLSILMDLGKYCDWDFDYVASWSIARAAMEVLAIDPLWLERLTLSKLTP